MYLSISLDRAAGESQADFKTRAQELESLTPDLVLLAREEDGVLCPPRIEALVDLAWISGILQTPAVIAGLPALHAIPFHVARALSAADYLSDGRSGWMPLMGGAQRFDAAYGASDDASIAVARADDILRATRALWDSWDDDALILDKASGRYLDSAKVRRVAYEGPYVATMGSLNAARPPQGHPLLVRDLDDYTGSSEAADIVIGKTLPEAGIRLLKTLADLPAAIARVQAGQAEGLHLCGPDALALLRSARAAHPANGPAVTGRARFSLPKPVNPFSAKVPA